MSRYIDADELKKVFSDGYEAFAETLCEIVDAQPTADVVEVVRCQDCIHCADDWNGNQPMFTCEIAMCNESVEPNGYCFLGERREDETD